MPDTPVAKPLSLFERAGGWLFRQRSWVPAPLILGLLLLPFGQDPHPARFWVAGAILVFWGEALRLWSVRHIGVISRTRSDRLGPLVTSGPFAITRNPLYVGNIALWTGFAVCERRIWAAALIAVILAVEYHLIVRWEEALLRAHRGDEYRRYVDQVPRWLPRWRSAPAGQTPDRFAWRDTLFSERGTLIAIAAGFLLLAWKSTF